ALAQQGGDRDGQQQRREREHGVHDAHDDAVGGAAEVAGDEAEREGHDQGQHHDDERGLEGDARAEDHPREQVAADVVGPEPVGRRRAGVEHREVLRRRVGGDLRGEDRNDRQRDEEHQGGHRRLVAHEARDEPAARRPADDRRRLAGLPAHETRTLGLRTPYMMSTTRLTTTNTTAVSRTTPCTMGRSLASMAPRMYLPMPGMEKISSMMTVPPNRYANWMPRMVMAGVSAFLRASCHTTRRSLIPIARAVRT